MLEILLLRHGRSTWNAEGRWQGWADPPLCADAMAQAASLGSELAGAGIGAVVSSDLRRASDTAELVAGSLHLARPHLLASLRERDIGEGTGKTLQEIEGRWPGWRERWRAGEEVPPGSEHRHAFVERVLGAIAEVAAWASHPRVAAVTHGGVFQVIAEHCSQPTSPVGNLHGRWVRVADGLISWGDALVPRMVA